MPCLSQSFALCVSRSVPLPGSTLSLIASQHVAHLPQVLHLSAWWAGGPRVLAHALLQSFNPSGLICSRSPFPSCSCTCLDVRTTDAGLHTATPKAFDFGAAMLCPAPPFPTDAPGQPHPVANKASAKAPVLPGVLYCPVLPWLHSSVLTWPVVFCMGWPKRTQLQPSPDSAISTPAPNLFFVDSVHPIPRPSARLKTTVNVYVIPPPLPPLCSQSGHIDDAPWRRDAM